MGVGLSQWGSEMSFSLKGSQAWGKFMREELEGRDKQAVIRAQETRKGPLARQRHRKRGGDCI